MLGSGCLSGDVVPPYGDVTEIVLDALVSKIVNFCVFFLYVFSMPM